MGQSVRCLASFAGQTGEGTAELETDELRFRGPFRLTIPLREVQRAEALDGRLDVTFPAGTAAFHLGASASRWAGRILHPPTLLDKLGARPGQRARLLGLPEGDERDLRRDLAAHGVTLTGEGDGETPPDLLFVGAATPGDLDAVGALRELLPPQGALWIVYPRGQKGPGAVREGDVIAAGRGAGLHDVKVVRFSATHTALKFVIPLADR